MCHWVWGDGWLASLGTLDFAGGTIVHVNAGIAAVVAALDPAAGYIGPMPALVLGAVAVVPSYLAIVRRSRTRLDDSLDVASALGVGGVVGALMTGVFATAAWGGTDGLLAGNAALLLRQATAVVAVLAYSGAVSLGLLKAISLFTPLRIDELSEARGLDVPLHGEEAYGTGEGAILMAESARYDVLAVTSAHTAWEHGA